MARSHKAQFRLAGRLAGDALVRPNQVLHVGEPGALKSHLVLLRTGWDLAQDFLEIGGC